jgi:hypothetical protein
VDPEWLSRRKFGGPTEEDLSALNVPDPTVALHLAYPPAARSPGDALRGGSNAAHDYAYNSVFGLRQASDGALLESRYRLDVNVDQVFGRVDADNSLLAGEADVREFECTNLLSLVSHCPVL